MIVIRNYGYPILPGATALWQAKNYSGSGAWLDEIGSADFQFGSTSGSDTNDPLWLPHSTSQNPFGVGVDYVYLPGTSSNYISRSGVTTGGSGNLTIVACVAADNWTPGTEMVLGPITGGTAGPFASITTTGRMKLWNQGSSSTTVTSDNVISAANGQFRWLKWEYRSSDHRVQMFESADSPLTNPEDVTWTQNGADKIMAAIGNSGPTNIWGGYSTSTLMFVGKFRGGWLYSGLLSGGSSSIVMACDINNGTISSTHSTLTGTGDGLTWTFNRSSTGRKLAVVDEDKFLLGTDDYFEAPNNSNFNFGTGDFTAIITVRAFSTVPATNFYYLIKRVSTSNLEGWGLGDSAVSGNDFFFVDGPSTSDQDLSYVGAFSSGLRKVYSGVRDSSNLTSYSNTTAGTPVTNSSRNVDNTSVLRIGYWSFSGNRFADCEIIAAAIFKDKALTADEVASVVSELAA